MSTIKTGLSILACSFILSACGSNPITAVNNSATTPQAAAIPTSSTRVANTPTQANVVAETETAAYAPTGHYGKAPSAVVQGDLFEAAKAGDIATVQDLLDQGANINSSNKQGETALHAATSANQIQMANLLIAKGANVNSTTIGGWTPLHTAARVGASQVLSLLVAKGANLQAVNADGRTPEALATAVKNVKMASLLRYHAGGGK